MPSMFYQLLGRATWALGKQQLKRRVHRTSPVTKFAVVGLLALGVVGIGAVAARSSGEA